MIISVRCITQETRPIVRWKNCAGNKQHFRRHPLPGKSWKAWRANMPPWRAGKNANAGKRAHRRTKLASLSEHAPLQQKGRLSGGLGILGRNIRQERTLLRGLLARRIERAGVVDFGNLVIAEAEHLAQDLVGVFAEQRRALHLAR